MSASYDARAGMRFALKWLLPGGGLFVLAWIAPAVAPASLLAQATLGYPWVALAAAFLLATLYHRSRAAVLALALAGVTWVETQGGFSPTGASVAMAAFATLIVVLAFTRDRGITAPGGWAQISAAGALGALALGLAVSPPAGFAEVLATRHLAPWATAWSGLPEGPVVVVLTGVAASAYAALRWRGPLERALFWTLCMAVVALHPASDAPARQIFLLAAALTLALSAVETSYALAYHDELTGLPARRALRRDIEALRAPYTAAMVDVDHFKKFNDRHGHDVGDQVLRMVAASLERTSGGGRAYRYGGEEFTLLFPGRPRDEALPHVEAVRAAVEAASFAVRSWARPRRKPAASPRHGSPSQGSPRQGSPRKESPTPRLLSVTVSIGVAEAGTGTSAEEVLKKADQALYRAKKGGRNRVAK